MPNVIAERKGFKSVFTAWDYALVKTGCQKVCLFDDLALLLPTSGSTGSPKLVRHSYRNIESNANNVRRLFELDGSEKAIAILPMHYTMGLSVIASHLLAGSTLLLSGRSLLDKGFWAMLKEATSFTGVPYSYEILTKMRFTRMDLPILKVITQGGGKLSEEMFKMLAQYAHDHGKKFIATYGQTECTARMAYLPAEWAMTKICSIGFAEPGGELSIIDKDGVETFEGEAEGEMVYRGENVTLGYATCSEDLLKGDENYGVMYTGDLARRDADGCYYIIGRLKRFLKIYGLRIGLDEVERMIKSEFETDCYCSGTDEMLSIRITNASIADKVAAFVEEKTHLFHKNIEVKTVQSILRNEAGKVMIQ
jgi:acyl-coenzyme A synthetase/AMP-(fatty) acid ligase